MARTLAGTVAHDQGGENEAGKPSARTGRIRRGVLVTITGAGLVASIGLALFLAVGLNANPWYRIVRIDGGSMAPTIGRGDLILVAPAPERVEPGMVLVMRVGDAVVTHRVVAVTAAGGLTTKGDANSVPDDWGGASVHVIGHYVATIPLLGAILPVASTSTALFTDGATATSTIRVVSLGPVFATVRIEPETINLKAHGDIKAFIDGLTTPHELSEIDLGSIQLCYAGTCIPSDGRARLDGTAHVAASFGREGFAALVGAARGRIVVTVRGLLEDGQTMFDGQDSVKVQGGKPCGGKGDKQSETGADAPTTCDQTDADLEAAASPTPDPDASPSPTPTVDPSPTPDPTASSSPEPTATPSPGPTSPATPEPTAPPAEPTPAPAADPTPPPTAEPTPQPVPQPTLQPTPQPTPEPTAPQAPDPAPEPPPAPDPGPALEATPEPTPAP